MSINDSSAENPKLLSALSLAEELGFRIVDAHPNSKKPRRRWKNRGGETIDRETIIDRWRECPDANPLVAVEESGLVVIDLDEKGGRNGISNWQALCKELDIELSTLTVRTPNKGLHLYFTAPDGVEIRNSQDKLAPGVEVKARGSVPLPPSCTPDGVYEFVDEDESLASLPQAIIDLIKSDPPEPPAPRVCESDRDWSRYVQKALTGEVARVANAVKGNRNNTLFKAAARLGSLVASPWAGLDRQDAEKELTQAASKVGLEPGEIRATIRSGIETGMKTPRPVPSDREEIARLAAAMIHWALERPWPGRTGAIDRGVYIAHLMVVAKTGKVAYDAASREVAEMVNISNRTASDAATRLVGSGFLWELSEDRSRRFESRRFCLVVPGEYVHWTGAELGDDCSLPLELHDCVGSKGSGTHISLCECAGFIGGENYSLLCECADLKHDAFSYRGLGQGGAQIWHFLCTRGAMGPEELAAVTGRGDSAIEKLLTRMGNCGLVSELDGNWSISPDADLDEAAVALGVAGRLEKRRKLHEEQRANFERWRDPTFGKKPEPEDDF